MKFEMQRFADDTVFLMNNLQGFVPSPIATDIIKQVVRGSSVMRLSKLVQMTSDNQQFPVMADGPGAYWVGEAEEISVSVARWIFPTMVARKLAVIIPVTREKLNDATINVFDTIKDDIAEAFYKKIDSACIFGTDSPFAKNIYTESLRNGMAIAEGTNSNLDLDVSDMMALVEKKGFDVDGYVADIGFKNSLRKLRDVNGNFIYAPNIIDPQGNRYDSLYSQPIEFNRNNAWDSSKALCIGGEWKYSLVGVRETIQYDVLREATLTKTVMSNGKSLSLAEQDMIGLRATMRLGFLPIRPEAFAVLVPKNAPTTLSGGVDDEF